MDGLDGSGIRSKMIFEINTYGLLLVDITFTIAKYKKKQFFLNRCYTRSSFSIHLSIIELLYNEMFKIKKKKRKKLKHKFRSRRENLIWE